jgi:hypothetical protein|tara:strand:- start:22 stop:594 length:573 start_codon:yes stop_codon:yes gene_type:complete
MESEEEDPTQEDLVDSNTEAGQFDASGENSDVVAKPIAPSNDPTDEQKQEVARWINDGVGLSDIQKRLSTEFGVTMTYMDVRFLVDDLNLTIQDEDEPEPEKTESEAEVPKTDPDADLLGSVSVDVDKVTRPGVMASGTATFSDGVNSPWYLDQFGRLGLTPKNEAYKPSDEDLAEFQKKLQAELQKSGM